MQNSSLINRSNDRSMRLTTRAPVMTDREHGRRRRKPITACFLPTIRLDKAMFSGQITAAQCVSIYCHLCNLSTNADDTALLTNTAHIASETVENETFHICGVEG